MRWRSGWMALLLLFVVASAWGQPGPEEAWLVVRVLAEDGKPATGTPSVQVMSVGATPTAFTPSLVEVNAVYFAGLVAGEYRVRGPQDERVITVVAGANVLDWQVPKPATLTIRVTTADGRDWTEEPVVMLRRLWAPATQYPARRLERSAGMVTVGGLVAGPLHVGVGTRALGTLEWREVMLEEGANTLDWRLLPSASVLFVFRNADGTPAAAADIRQLQLSRGGKGNVGRGAFGTPEADSWLVAGISPDRYRATISSPGGELANMDVEVVAGENLVVWTLPETAALAITLRVAGSRALPDGEMRLMLYAPGTANVRYSLEGNGVAGGGWEWDALPVGEYDAALQLTAPGPTVLALGRQVVQLSAGANTLDWKIPLLCDVTIEVRHAGGRPVTEMPLRVRMVQQNGMAAAAESRTGAAATWRQRFPWTPAGEYRATLTHRSAMKTLERTVTVAAEVGTLVLRLDPQPPLAITLKAGDGLPAPSRARAFMGWELTAAGEVADGPIVGGELRVAEMMPGRYRLLVVGEGRYGFAKAVLTPANGGLACEVTMARGCRLEIATSRMAGETARGYVELNRRAPVEDDVGAIALKVELDERGTATLDGLPPGDWALSPHTLPLNMAPMSVKVTAGETTRVELARP